MIIGLTGTNGAGKTVTADHLQTKGFYFHSLSDEIRAELARQEMEANRENLIRTGNALRAEFGPAVLAERIKARLRPDRNYVVDSIRNPYEVDALRALGDFKMLHLDAPRPVRFDRVVARGGPRTPQSFEEFVEQEEREMTSADPSHQQLRATWAKADSVLRNEGSIADLKSAVDKVVSGWLMQSQRPGWDEYFMQIAKIVSLRSNCMKRKVAAVIVKDKRIISTGYNGTPRGVKNCNEGGCPRCNSFADSGSSLGECLCSHAEENSIVQAAYHGISVKDATLYSTFSPCLICTKMIINAGIREVVFNMEYPLLETARALLEEAGVLVRKAASE
ncbi:MAG: AAA family ATPase [Acidobacteria bacterium]|nr:AAA family ATPase [Acidobacteriota bacterium]